MKIAVIGCGSIGRRHIGNFLALGHDVIAFNRGETRRKAVEKEFLIETYADVDEMLSAPDLDSIIICSPNNMHILDALNAAKYGYNLFIEKPLSLCGEDISPLQSQIEKYNSICHIACNMRFHFGPEKLKKILELEELGEVAFCNVWGGMHLPDWHPEEDYREMYSAKKILGGGVVLDFIHEIDLVLWYFGIPLQVVAFLENSGCLEIETEDVADILMNYNNFQLNMHLDYLQKPFQRGIRIVGEKGWAEWDLTRDGVEVYLYAEAKSHWHSYPTSWNNNEMYLKQARYFVDCVQSNRTSFSSLESGSQAMAVASRIFSSAQQLKIC